MRTGILSIIILMSILLLSACNKSNNNDTMVNMPLAIVIKFQSMEDHRVFDEKKLSEFIDLASVYKNVKDTLSPYKLWEEKINRRLKGGHQFYCNYEITQRISNDSAEVDFVYSPNHSMSRYKLVNRNGKWIIVSILYESSKQ